MVRLFFWLQAQQCNLLGFWEDLHNCIFIIHSLVVFTYSSDCPLFRPGKLFFRFCFALIVETIQRWTLQRRCVVSYCWDYFKNTLLAVPNKILLYGLELIFHNHTTVKSKWLMLPQLRGANQSRSLNKCCSVWLFSYIYMRPYWYYCCIHVYESFYCFRCLRLRSF